jgi:hypothetical protein
MRISFPSSAWERTLAKLDSTVFDPEACDELDSTELAEVSRAAQTRRELAEVRFGWACPVIQNETNRKTGFLVPRNMRQGFALSGRWVLCGNRIPGRCPQSYPHLGIVKCRVLSMNPVLLVTNDGPRAVHSDTSGVADSRIHREKHEFAF